MLAGCGQVSAGAPASTAVGSQGQPSPSSQLSQAHRPHGGLPTPTAPILPPPGPYRPVSSSPTNSAGRTPVDLSQFAPGVRHLLEDLQSGALSPYEFCKLTLAKLSLRPVTLPARYADREGSLTQVDMAALALVSRRAASYLSAEQIATLKSEATAQR